MKDRYGLFPTLYGAVLLGALSTIGDIVWDAWITSHRLIFGLIHGVAICAAMGLVLGLAAGGAKAKQRGVMVAPLIGLLAAGSYYALAGLIGYWAMFASWALLWVMCAWLYQRLRNSARSNKAFLARGLIAAVLSGLAFYAIADIWLDPPANPNYLYYLLAWSFAFFPGFLALFFERTANR